MTGLPNLHSPLKSAKGRPPRTISTSEWLSHIATFSSKTPQKPGCLACTEIAEKYGVCVQTISNWILRSLHSGDLIYEGKDWRTFRSGVLLTSVYRLKSGPWPEPGMPPKGHRRPSRGRGEKKRKRV